jgi:hypothetical protein
VKRRYQNGSELARDLAPFASSRHRTTIQRILSLGPEEEPQSIIIASGNRSTFPGMDSPTVPAPEPGQVSQPATSRRGPLIALLVMLLFVGAIVYAKHRLG